MSKIHDDLELMALTLIKSRLERWDHVFVFTVGNLRGKLLSAEYLECLPSSTYLASNGSLEDQIEPCVQLTYIPRPRSHDRVTDPVKFKFTRKPVHFNIPVRVIGDALFLHKIEEGAWMLNVNTAVKR